MSRQPRKQRRERRTASLHERQKYLRAHLDPDLREEYDARRVRVNAGDEVEVQRGDAAGDTGEVTDVDLRDGTIAVDGVTVETADGEEVPRRLEPSNVQIVDLDLEDTVRRDRLEGE